MFIARGIAKKWKQELPTISPLRWKSYHPEAMPQARRVRRRARAGDMVEARYGIPTSRISDGPKTVSNPQPMSMSSRPGMKS